MIQPHINAEGTSVRETERGTGSVKHNNTNQQEVADLEQQADKWKERTNEWVSVYYRYIYTAHLIENWKENNQREKMINESLFKAKQPKRERKKRETKRKECRSLYYIPHTNVKVDMRYALYFLS